MNELAKFALLYAGGILTSGLGVVLLVNGILMMLKGLRVIP